MSLLFAAGALVASCLLFAAGVFVGMWLAASCFFPERRG